MNSRHNEVLGTSISLRYNRSNLPCIIMQRADQKTLRYNQIISYIRLGSNGGLL